jgi:hypothetical protein
MAGGFAVTDRLVNAKVWDGSAWVDAGVPWWGLPSEGQADGNFATVTCDTTAHVKGPWTQIISSTAAASDVLGVLFQGIGANNQNSATLVDIGVGASGSEVAVIENLAVGGANVIFNCLQYSIPLAIPQGTRIAARAQSVVSGGKTAVVAVSPFSTNNFSKAPLTVTVIGTSTATSEGVPSLSNNTWTEITASSPAKFQAVILVPSLTSTTASAGFSTIELGVGSSGNEVSINTVLYRISANEVISVFCASDLVSIAAGPFPSGTRFSARASAQATTLDYCLIGIPYP